MEELRSRVKGCILVLFNDLFLTGEKKQNLDFRTVRIISFSRVESWRSSCLLYLQLPLIKPDVRFSRIRLSNHLLPEAFAFTWPFSIASTGVLGIFGVNSVAAIPFLPSFRSMMKVCPFPLPKLCCA